MKNWNFLIMIVFTTSYYSKAQSPYLSEAIIKYDIQSQKTDKPIPFDKPFTLMLEKSGIKNVKMVEAYEVKRNKDTITYVLTKTKLSGRDTCLPIRDASFESAEDKEQLFIYLTPLKPKVEFNLFIGTKLNKEAKLSLFKASNLHYKSSVNKSLSFYEGNKEYNALRKKNVNPKANLTFFGLDSSDFQKFYFKELDSAFATILTNQNLKVDSNITLKEIQALSIGIDKSKVENNMAHYLLNLLENKAVKTAQYGTANIYKSYTKDFLYDPYDLAERLPNLESNAVFIDSLLIGVNKAIVLHNETINIDGITYNLNTIKKTLITIKDNCLANAKTLKKSIVIINKRIDENDDLSQLYILTANTIPSDLKTEGGNYFTLNLGFAGIAGRKLNNLPLHKDKYQFIPKLYYGISIHFRPVDKNTRRSNLPSKDDLDINTSLTNAALLKDAGMLSYRTIYQRASLNIGFTTGNMYNKDFDNFIGTTSLLIGPSVRLGRIINLSAGTSIMRRSSFNPAISEKKVNVGAYASIAIDLDFVSAIKDVYSVLLK